MDRTFAWYRFGGLVAGTLIACGGLVLCGYLIHQGQSGWAVGSFLGEITALAALFVIGRYVRSNGNGNGAGNGS